MSRIELGELHRAGMGDAIEQLEVLQLIELLLDRVFYFDTIVADVDAP